MEIAVFYHHLLEAAKQKGGSLEESMMTAKQAGITAVELDRDEIKDPQTLRVSLQKAGLEVSSIYGFYAFEKQEEQEKIKQHVQLAEIMESKKIMVVPGFYSEQDSVVRKRELERMLEGTRRVCELAQAKRIQVTIEDFDDLKSPLHTLAGMQTFIEQIPNLYVTFDTGNFILSHEDELEAFEALKGRIRHVHCKDRRYDLERHICPSSVGKGVIQMQRIIEKLKAIHYQGRLVIEHFGAEDYLEYIVASAKWLQNTKGEEA